MWYFLAASLVSLGFNRILALCLLIMTVLQGMLNNTLDYHVLIIILIALTSYLVYTHSDQECKKTKITLNCIAFFVATGLTLHIIPGFNNLKVLDSVIVGPQSSPFTMYYNFDKALVPFILVVVIKTLFVTEPVRKPDLVSWIFLILSVPSLLLLGVALGGVKFELHLPDWFFQFAFANIFFVSLAEEALFRGYLQQRLTQVVHPVIALIISSLLFGLMHYAGGFLMVTFAFLSGIIYGLAWMWSGKLWVSVIFHFILNSIHLCFFTYPMYSPH